MLEKVKSWPVGIQWFFFVTGLFIIWIIAIEGYDWLRHSGETEVSERLILIFSVTLYPVFFSGLLWYFIFLMAPWRPKIFITLNILIIFFSFVYITIDYIGYYEERVLWALTFAFATQIILSLFEKKKKRSS